MEVEENDVGSALAALPDAPVLPADPSKTPVAQQPREPKQKEDLRTRLEKAEGAVQRHKENGRQTYEELQRTKAEIAAARKEKEELAQRVAYIDELKARIAEGDEEALAELGGSFDTFVQRKLDPDSVRQAREAHKGLSATEKKLAEIERKLAEKEEQERNHAVQRDLQVFLETVKSNADDFPELQLVEPDEAIELGRAIAPHLAEHFGRAPTFREIARGANALLEDYHQKVYTAMKEREARKAAQAAAAASSLQQQQVTQPVKRRVVENTTVPARASTMAASSAKPMTPDERREAAVKKLKELHASK